MLLLQTVSPNVHSSMARGGGGGGSPFKRSRSGAIASPDGSGSPLKGGGGPSLSPSPVDPPSGSGSPFRGGGGGSGAHRCDNRSVLLGIGGRGCGAIGTLRLRPWTRTSEVESN